jgi:hypothetical protein
MKGNPDLSALIPLLIPASVIELAEKIDGVEIKKWIEKTVGTFVGGLLQNSAKLWVVPTPSSTHKILATH